MIDQLLSQKGNLIVKFSKEATTPVLLHSSISVSSDHINSFHQKLLEYGIENVFKNIEEKSFPSILQNMVHTDGSRGFNETILVWNPNLILILDSKTKVIDDNGTIEYSEVTFWELVPQLLEAKKLFLENIFSDKVENQTLLHDYCGFYGYLSYEASRHLENYVIRKDEEVIPTSVFTFPTNYLIERENDFIYIDFSCEVLKFPELKIMNQYKKPDSLTAKTRYLEYIGRIQSVTNYIIEGDIYQANYTQQFELPRLSNENNPRNIFTELIKLNPVQHSAYLEYPNLQILSISPELFLSIKNGIVVTKPIKGTRPRGNSEEEDEKLISELLNSEKDLAELSMIVDLLRNDLGKSCFAGSVTVDKHAAIESYSNVHHLVSTISGEIESSPSDSWRLFLRAFPGGSITGCPKIRAMEIIEELETAARGVYTGSIGYITINGNLQFNIAIRTITMTQEKIIFNAGGGIVADSKPIDEYVESLHKANHLVSYFGNSFIGNIIWINGEFKFKGELEWDKINDTTNGFFETMLVKNSRIQNLNKHWKRLEKGMEYYAVSPILPSFEIIQTLIKINIATDARLKLSILVAANEVYSILELSPYQILNQSQKLIIDKDEFEFTEEAEKGIKPLNYKKYREKTITAVEKGFWDYVLVDDQKNMIETGRANLYFYTDKWYTSINKCVRGITRMDLIAKNIVIEKNIRTDELKYVKAIAISNSLIGILPITILTNEEMKIEWETTDKDRILLDLLQI